MAIVTHRIHGRLYDYDHRREGKQVKTYYLGCAGGGNRVISGLKDRGFRSAPGYVERHAYANQKEREKFGEERFNELQKHIQERTPEGELAGKYDECNTYVNKRIDPKYHEQIKYHEEQEREYQRTHQS